MVNSRLLQPQEIEVHYVLPALRRELTLAMKRDGLEQKEIAKRLHVTEPAVSQYVNNKRGTDLDLSANAMAAIAESARRIRDTSSLLGEMQKLLRLMVEERVTCKLHMKMAGVDQDCDVCFDHPSPHPNVRLQGS